MPGTIHRMDGAKSNSFVCVSVVYVCMWVYSYMLLVTVVLCVLFFVHYMCGNPNARMYRVGRVNSLIIKITSKLREH